MKNKLENENISFKSETSFNYISKTDFIDYFRSFIADENTNSIDKIFDVYAKSKNPDFITMLTCALMAKESVIHRDVSINLLWRTMSLFPDEPAVYYELAVALNDDNLELRIRLLQQAIKISPDFNNAIKSVSAAYLMAGHLFCAADEADTNRERTTQIDKDWIGTGLNYLRCLEPTAPLEKLVDSAISAVTNQPKSTIEDISDVLIATANRHKPFALVRLGDGEGAIANFSDEEEIRNADLYKINREYFSNRWFGQPYEITERPLRKIYNALESNLHDADIIGYPDENWIKHELLMGNLQTFSCCLNAARLGSACAARGSALSTRTSIHFDLLGRGVLAELLEIRKKVAFISSHMQLPVYLTNRFPRVEVVHSFRLPPAHSDLPITGYSIINRAYDVMPVIADSFNNIDRKAVVLVGAGFVGKAICIKLKSMGFMVIDVGSIFDHMMGFSTRPNFSHYDLDTCFKSRETGFS